MLSTHGLSQTGYALPHSRSLSLSLYRAWGRQQRPGCLPRADTHTRVPWQVVSSPRAFRTEGLGCTRNGLTKRKGKERHAPPTTSSGVPKTFMGRIEDEFEPPPPNSNLGCVKKKQGLWARLGPGLSQFTIRRPRGSPPSLFKDFTPTHSLHINSRLHICDRAVQGDAQGHGYGTVCSSPGERN